MDIPLEEDSPDLTDEMIASAIVTHNTHEQVMAMGEAIAPLSGIKNMPSHALKRRKPHLYSVTKIEFSDGSTRFLVFQVDWLKQGG